MSAEDSTSPTPVRLLLADDHDILRQGLKLLLEAEPYIRIIGEARTGMEAVEQTKQLRPDIVVMDISMRQMDGLQAAQTIRSQQPTTQVLILTMHESEEYFFQALCMGAAGYLIKKAAPADLSAAVRTIAQGGVYLYPGLARALIRAYLASQPSTPLSSSTSPGTEGRANLVRALAVLTPREMEVLKLVAQGRSNQEIAELLGVSIKTVQAHRAHVMEKLGLSDITHLVRFAIHHGLIPSEP